ncbi:MAG: UDP-N-acetylmuramoyl-L-alanine--D-glutamate ligase [Burkholderiaceae bacterium]
MAALQAQHVLVLGLGASGLAMARWCSSQGAQVTVADTRAAPPQAAALQQDVPAAKLVTGAFAPSLLDAAPDSPAAHAVTAVYKSPGLTPASVASVFIAARARNILAGGELNLFFEALNDLQASQGYAPKVLAITGTNGKTTVTSLTALLVQRAGLSVAVAGNIGPTLLDTLADHLQRDALPAVWVLELSSFQLEDAGDLFAQGAAPTAACVLNISQDHLDWHGSMAAYVQAKQRIFGPDTLRIVNRSETALGGASPPLQPRAGAASKALRSQAKLARAVSFGTDLPTQPGDFGLATENGVRWLVRAQPGDDTPRQRKHTSEPLQLQHLMPSEALRIRGTHNALNALAALALAQAAGCPLASMLHGLRDYAGEPHRAELVAVLADVQYIDDSKGTNVGATVAALQGLGEAQSGTPSGAQKLIAILGGDGKGQDFSPLAAPVARYCRAVILIGRDAPALREALAATGTLLHNAADMPSAVQQAAALARGGDAVLLSPACASFDMFADYTDRARAFRGAVQALAGAAAQILEGAL